MPEHTIGHLSRQRGRAWLATPTAQLAMTYLLIIMVLSISFSFVFYNTSAHELGRQIPPDAFFDGANDGQDRRVNDFFMERVAEARQALQLRLVLLNAAALGFGSVVSYYLARRNLQPIEAAMEAQSQFVSDASHELRTPLTAIQVSNEVALRKPELDAAEARQLIEHNLADIGRLKDLTDALLNLARQQQIPILQPVKLQDVLSNALNQVVGQATAKRITVDDRVGPDSVSAEAAGLERVLVILLDNAIKYSPAGSTITVSTRAKGRTIFLDVRDAGIGIRASDLPHVFRRFYRADTSRTTGSGQHGYGLGLAIARQLMQSQQGDITVKSSPGKGSTFTLKLAVA